MSGIGIVSITSDEIIKLNIIAIEQSGGVPGVLNESTVENCSDLITNVFFGVQQHFDLMRRALNL
jgi:hypothetical protein